MSGHGKEAVRLCQQIVRQAFGPVVCSVASQLLNRGRLSSREASRLSGQPVPTTLASLVLLIQHNLVLSNGASIKATDEDEIYEFDVKECLMRLRWGRMLAVTAEMFGQESMEIIRQLMIYGKMKAGEIVAVSASGGDGNKVSAVKSLTVALVRGGFLVPTHPELQILASDQVARRLTALRRHAAKHQNITMPSAQQLMDMETRAVDEITNERDGYRHVGRILVATKKAGTKKSRGKEEEEIIYSLKPDVHLRVNYDKFSVLVRNQLIIKAAEDRWNAGAAAVMRAVLESSIHELDSPRDIRTHDAVGLNTILSHIPDKTYRLLAAGMAGSSSKNTTELARLYLQVLAGEDMMMSNGGAFLSREGSTNAAYKVELESICQTIRASLLSELVRQRLGEKAARVLAVVARASKAGETMVRDCAMIPLKEARQILSSLQTMSLVETQEVPRTAAKARPGFSVGEYHLWQVDLAKVYGFLLSGVYKTLANILQRKSKELERKRIVSERLRRVKNMGGRERLPQKDQEDLVELEDVLKKLTLAEARTELVVMILRDLPGGQGQR